MNERFKIFYQNLIIIADNSALIAADAVTGFSVYAFISKWAGIAGNAFVAIFVGVSVASIAFVLQKTILPKIIDHINLNWFKRK